MKYTIGKVYSYLPQKESRQIERTFRNLFREYRDIPQCQIKGSHCSIGWYELYYVNVFQIFWVIEHSILPTETIPYH